MHWRYCAGAALLASLLLGPTARAQDAPGRSATIKQVQGLVAVVAGESRRAAEPGARVVENERIETGATGAASLVLRDGTVLSVGPRTSLDLSRFRFEGTTQEGEISVRLLRGTLRMITGLVAKRDPSRVVITTPTLTVGIRGTDFIVEEE